MRIAFLMRANTSGKKEMKKKLNKVKLEKLFTSIHTRLACYFLLLFKLKTDSTIRFKFNTKHMVV